MADLEHTRRALVRFAAALGLPIGIPARPGPLATGLRELAELCALHGVKLVHVDDPADSRLPPTWLELVGADALYLRTATASVELFRHAEDLATALDAATDGAYLAQLGATGSKVATKRAHAVAEAWFVGLWGPGTGRILDKLKATLGSRVASKLTRALSR